MILHNHALSCILPGMMRLSGLIELLNELAPEHFAESWDHVGLHIGSDSRSVRIALLCIDLTEAVLEEAKSKKVDLIISYHPPLFNPIKSLTDRTSKSRIILKAAELKLAVYSPHTALDAAPGGVNDWLAECLGPGRVQPVTAAGASIDTDIRQCKMVTFSPADEVDRIRKALAVAGAGQIGHYSECSYNLCGWGTFKGDRSTSPTVGRAMKLEKVEEVRIEMVTDYRQLPEVIAALRAVHSYEKPAFDIYPLVEPPVRQLNAGQGRLVTLDQPVSLTTLIRRVKSHLGLDRIEVGKPRKSKPVRRVALCAGAGGSLLEKAGPIDAFITGEMRHHAVLDAVESGVAVLLAGHTQTERPYLAHYRDRLKQIAPQVRWHISRKDKPPTKGI